MTKTRRITTPATTPAIIATRGFFEEVLLDGILEPDVDWEGGAGFGTGEGTGKGEGAGLSGGTGKGEEAGLSGGG